jgi:hypothetical protein
VCVFLGNELWWICFARIISPRLLTCLLLSREKESELRRWILDSASGVGCRNSHSRRSWELRKEELFFLFWGGGEGVVRFQQEKRNLSWGWARRAARREVSNQSLWVKQLPAPGLRRRGERIACELLDSLPLRVVDSRELRY